MKLLPSLSSDIIDYYHTNYSTCPKESSYFATWQFLTTCTHFVLIIEVPLAILTGYCILQKTPKAMGSLKWAMLNVHFWTTYIGILLCSLVTPYIFFPALSGFPVGLLSLLDVPYAAQTYLGFVSIGFELSAICSLFENRSSSFQLNPFRIERNWVRVIMFLVNGGLEAVFLLPLFLRIPDQNPAKYRCLQILKCPTEDYFTRPIFILVGGDIRWGFYLTLILGIQWLFIFSSVFFFIGCTTYHIFYSKENNYSDQTKMLQKMFFIGNLVQITIPMMFCTIPVFLVWSLVYFNYYNQALNNIAVCIVSLHGVASMICVLLIHRPYREFLGKQIGTMTCSKTNVIVRI